MAIWKSSTIAALGALALLASPSLAADVLRYESGGTRFLLLTGEIQKGDDLKFEEASRDLDDAIVVLRSPGGEVNASMAIGRSIRRKGFATAVMGRSICNSGCAAIWLSGKQRMLDGDAAVGFHSVARQYPGGHKFPSSVGNALVGAYLNEIGMTTQNIIQLMTPAHDDIVWIRAADARRLGISVTWLNTRLGVLLSERDEDWSKFGNWIQAARHEENAAAVKQASALRQLNANVAVFGLKDGGYAVALGPYRGAVTAEIEALVKAREIPAGSVAVSGERFSEHAWGHRPKPLPMPVSDEAVSGKAAGAAR